MTHRHITLKRTLLTGNGACRSRPQRSSRNLNLNPRLAKENSSQPILIRARARESHWRVGVIAS